MLGDIHVEYDWDWPAAQREMRTAVLLAPNDPLVLLLAAIERLAVGRYSESLRFLDTAVAADPLDPQMGSVLNSVYLRLGRLAEAESAARRLLDISPTYAVGHYKLGLTLLVKGENAEALAEMQKEVWTPRKIAGHAVVYHAMHRTWDSDTALARLKADHAGDRGMLIAGAHAFRGEKDQAFVWLDRAYAQKDSDLYSLKSEPLLKTLETDPRYKAFLRKMKLPE
jgi:serine/threonine-protein kinase